MLASFLQLQAREGVWLELLYLQLKFFQHHVNKAVHFSGGSSPSKTTDLPHLKTTFFFFFLKIRGFVFFLPNL